MVVGPMWLQASLLAPEYTDENHDLLRKDLPNLETGKVLGLF